jgi:hypothetical protein
MPRTIPGSLPGSEEYSRFSVPSQDDAATVGKPGRPPLTLQASADEVIG